MKINDRIERIKTKGHYKIIDIDNGEVIAQRLISGGTSDNIIKLRDFGGYKFINEKENSIEYFDGDYNFLSNFYEHEVFYEGKLYPTNEHAFQAAKTFNENEKEKIRKSKTASRAKFLGRKVKLRDDWEDVKIQIMYDICLEKFKNEDLKEKLLNTGDKMLVEGNTWGDDFWGKFSEEGLNHLGEILMKVRNELR